MPYSDDRKRLEEMLPYMGALALGKNTEWTIARGNPTTVAFRIREALRIARLYPSEYPDLAKYAGDYAINTKVGNMVTARRRTPDMEAHVVEKPAPYMPNIATQPSAPVVQTIDVVEAHLVRTIGAKSNSMFEAQKSNHILQGKQTSLSVADVYRQLGEGKPTLHFPDAGLGKEELKELFFWAGNHVPPLMLLVDGIGLTVARFDAMVAEFSWRPDDTE